MAASAAYSLGQTGSALSSLKKAVELDPEFAEALGPRDGQLTDSLLAIWTVWSRTNSCMRLSPAPPGDVCPPGSTRGSQPIWNRAIARGAQKASTVVPLADLTNGFSGLDEQGALVAYAESTAAAEIRCAKLGSNIGGFLQMVGNGSSVDEALLAFQVQPDAFHSEWRRQVGLR